MNTQETTLIEIIKPRSYVACLSQGLAFPFIHFGQIFRFVGPLILVGALLLSLMDVMQLHVLHAFWAGDALTNSQWLLLGLPELVGLFFFILLVAHILYQQRFLAQNGQLPKVRAWQVGIELLQPRLFALPFNGFRWRYVGRLLAVLFLAGLASLAVLLLTALPALMVVYVDGQAYMASVMGEVTGMPAYFPYVCYLSFVLYYVFGAFALMTLAYPLLFHKGAVMAIERERTAGVESLS